MSGRLPPPGSSPKTLAGPGRQNSRICRCQERTCDRSDAAPTDRNRRPLRLDRDDWDCRDIVIERTSHKTSRNKTALRPWRQPCGAVAVARAGRLFGHGVSRAAVDPVRRAASTRRPSRRRRRSASISASSPAYGGAYENREAAAADRQRGRRNSSPRRSGRTSIQGHDPQFAGDQCLRAADRTALHHARP